MPLLYKQNARVMSFSLKDYRIFTHPIVLTAFYLILTICYALCVYESVLGIAVLVWLIFLLNIGLVSVFVVNILKDKKGLIFNLLAYIIWALAIVAEYLLFKRYFQKELEIVYFLTILPVGLITVLLNTYENLELNILALGSFSTFLYFLSFNSPGYTIALAIILVLLAFYSKLLVKDQIFTVKQVLVSFCLGIIVYLLSFGVTKLCVSLYFAHLLS